MSVGDEIIAENFQGVLAEKSTNALRIFGAKRKRQEMSAIVVLTFCLVCNVTGLGADRDVRSSSVTANVLTELFDQRVLDRNFAAVQHEAEIVSPQESFAKLSAWVLGEDIRLSNGVVTSDNGLESEFSCPALALVDAAKNAGKLDVLRAKVEVRFAGTIAQQATRAALLLAIDVASEKSTGALEHAQILESLAGGPQVPVELRQALIVAAWAGRQDSRLREILNPVLKDEYAGLIQNPLQSGDSLWTTSVSGLSGLYTHLAAGRPAVQFGKSPQLREWSPTTVATHAAQSQSWLPTHWRFNSAGLQCLSSKDQNLLYYRLPLRGDFEVSCELSDYAYQQIQLVYSGHWMSPRQKRANFFAGDLRQRQQHAFSKQLIKSGPWVRCSLIVRNGVCTTWLNGRKVFERQLPAGNDPWLAIRCESPYQGMVRNLRIIGRPEIPKAVNLVNDETLSNWVPWFDDSVGQSMGNWSVARDEDNTPMLIGRRRDALHGTKSENLLSYQRPIVEDGKIEYEFFYSPGKIHAHPAVGRQAYLLQPNGVRGHVVGESLNAVNVATAADLRLKADDWNTATVSLTGGQLDISVNGQRVLRDDLPLDHPRTFGLFHFGGQTQLRVRHVVWTGNWGTHIPECWQQELAGNNLEELDRTRDLLPAVFAHSFAREGPKSEYFDLKGHGKYLLKLSAAGVTASVNGLDRYAACRLIPHFSIEGDFDITAAYQQFNGGGGKEVNIRINAMLQQDELRTMRTRSPDDKQFFKGGALQQESEGKRRLISKRVGTASNSGKLRLARRGDIVTYAFAESESADFHVLEVQKHSAAPIEIGGLSLVTAAAQVTTVSATWTNIEIAAERLLYSPPGGAAGRKGIYVLTLPEDANEMETDIPLWRQYCAKRMEAYQLTANDANGDPVARMAEPIMIHEAGEFSKGLVYLWLQKDGRPAAIGTSIVQGNITSGVGLTEVNEFHSLHEGPLSMTLKGVSEWKVEQPGLAWKEILHAPRPAESPELLFAQARVLANRFSGHQGTNSKHDLPLQDAPIYRYSFELDGRTLVGILTSFVVSNDPEVLLNLQVRKNGIGEYRWHFAGAKYTAGAVAIKLDGEEAWKPAPGSSGRTSVRRGWFPNRDLNLTAGLASLQTVNVERVYDLPQDMSYMGQPEWAFDGKSLVFHRSGPPQGLSGAIMGRLDLETKQLTDIGLGCMPCLAPNGEEMVFNRVGAGVMRANSDGSNEEVLDANGWATGWSPNGQHIVWGTRNNCTLMEVATGKRRQLLTPEQSAQISYMYWNTSWSPNSQSIAFNAIASDTEEEILVVVDIASTDGFKILFRGNIMPDVAWHPDSRRVLFARSEGNRVKRLYLMDRYTDTDPTLLPGQPEGFQIQDCDWSPDGKKIAFAAIPSVIAAEWTGKPNEEDE